MIKMNAIIRRWGNSLALRLPGPALEAARLAEGEAVTLRVTRGRIVIEPAEVIEYDLDTLVASIDADNSHGEVDLGGPVGREAW
jgi:antitoxin MazE